MLGRNLYFNIKFKGWDDFDEKVKAVVLNGTSVLEIGYLLDFELEYGKWYRSKDRIGGAHPFASYMLNKKWFLEEEFNNHILRFQQVRVSFYLLHET